MSLSQQPLLLSLKNHPFAVEAFFERSLVLTYALPQEVVMPLIPLCLLPDTFQGQWAFVAVALVQARKLRPKSLPQWIGQDFILIGLRVFVTYQSSEGKRLRGLYILRSETNQGRMARLGNIFTHYQYSTTDLALSHTEETISIYSKKSALDIEVRKDNPAAPLPAGSPFPDWKRARRYAGPLPYTFTYLAASREVLIIEGVRNNWLPLPLEVVKSKVGFLEQPVFQGAVLASAFLVENIPYHWKKGRLEKWLG